MICTGPWLGRLLRALDKSRPTCMCQLLGTGSVEIPPISRANKRRKFALSPAQSRVASCPALGSRTAKNSPRRRPRLRLSRDVSIRAAPIHMGLPRPPPTVSSTESHSAAQRPFGIEASADVTRTRLQMKVSSCLREDRSCPLLSPSISD
jgi:hypothetical protein